MDYFYDKDIDRDKLIALLNDCQINMDNHLSKAIYYKYLAQQTRALIQLHGFDFPKDEEIQTIKIYKKIPKIKLFDNSTNENLKKLKGNKLEMTLKLFND